MVLVVAVGRWGEFLQFVSISFTLYQREEELYSFQRTGKDPLGTGTPTTRLHQTPRGDFTALRIRVKGDGP